MTTAQITGGTVEYTKPSNYQTDKPGAKVVLTFMCAEGCPPAEAEEMLDRTARMAVAKAHDMVGDKPPVAAEKAKRAKAPPAEVPAANPSPSASVDASSVSAPGSGTAPSSASSGVNTDPAAIGEPEPIELAEVGTIIPPITDKDLHAAVQIAIEKKVTSAQIRAATLAITGNPGQSMTTIAQDRRAEFLAAVKALYSE